MGNIIGLAGGVAGLDNRYAPLEHQHPEYAATEHSHDYAPIVHSHDYAPSEHTHNYAPIVHSHDYAPSEHTHNYAPIVHSHDYAPSEHSHDYAPAEHSHAAAALIPGTFSGTMQAQAAAVQALGTAQLRNITISTVDLTAGTSPLPCGDLYFVYEV